jgi:RNA polymerase sigma-70 factor (ECF subfamily)
MANPTNGTVAELYWRYGPATYAWCRRLLRDAASAEDATQETFIRVMRHLKTAPSDAEALRWIRRISTNYCLNVVRDQSRRAESMADVPEVEGEHPESWMLDRDLAVRLLMRAPNRLRSPAMLHYVYGMEQEQIALMLGISRRTVINRLRCFAWRARKFVARQQSPAAHAVWG